MSIYTCQCTHVQNHAYASESRGMYLWDVRQLLKSVMIKKKVLQKKVSYDKKKVLQKKVENSDQTKVIVLFGSSMPTLCPFYTLEYNFCWSFHWWSIYLFPVCLFIFVFASFFLFFLPERNCETDQCLRLWILKSVSKLIKCSVTSSIVTLFITFLVIV